jgi:uncharacterized RDD family membrane protein YckC
LTHNRCETLRTAARPQFFSITMSSSPQLDPSDLDPALSSGTALWKDEVADRLAAHRLRRDRRAPDSDLQSALFTPVADDPNRAARIAAAIADRYARQPSYHDVLAAQEEAERERQRLADEEARAAAAALAAAQQPAPEEVATPEPKPDLDHRRRYIETSHRVVLHAPMPAPMPRQIPSRAASAHDEDAKEAVARAIARAEAEDLFNAVLVEPTVPLPAKLIEFPRELIAPRKARPRLAEGPLQAVASMSTGDRASQLRIFEVETETISHQPPPADDPVSVAPNWLNIRLDDNQGPRWEFEAPAASPFALPLHPAALSRRALATAVDFACVAGAFAGFAAVFFFSTTHPPMTRLGAEFGGGIFVLLFALYQWMFFTYAESTPGMRAARIALCTFDDTNPTRRAMRLRLGAVLLAACPFGLGFLWAVVDEDGLGWHDRIARMYQRSY